MSNNCTSEIGCLCQSCRNCNGKKCKITHLTGVKNTCKGCEKGSHALLECDYFMEKEEE